MSDLVRYLDFTIWKFAIDYFGGIAGHKRGF